MKTMSFFGGLLIWSLTLFQCAWAQTQIHGNITNSEQHALAFANVLLLTQQDSSLVKGSLANESGKFIFEDISPGNYLIRIDMIGYRTSYAPGFTIRNAMESYPAGTFILDPQTVTLDKVEIIAEKPMFEQQIDRMIINVQNSIVSAGGSVLEVLERSPGIMVDWQNSSIGMGGKQGVILMINGKQSRMPMDAAFQLLAGMNADNIEKIELITTPPARFDAEGDAGIINVVLKKNLDYGVNGNYTLSAGYGRESKRGASLNLNYRKNKLNLFGDYSYSRDHGDQHISFERRVSYQGKETLTLGESDRDPIRNLHNARVGFDYELSSKTIVGGLVSGYINNWKTNDHNQTIYEVDKVNDGFLDIQNDRSNSWEHIMGNLNLVHKFDDNKKLSIDLDYLTYGNDNPSYYENSYLDGKGDFVYLEKVQLSKLTPIDVFVTKVDYSQDIGKDIQVEAGLKGTLYRLFNDIKMETEEQGAWIVNPDFTNAFDLKEDIGAVYASVRAKLNAKTTLQAGLRYEYTQTHLGSEVEPDIVDRKYGNLFPSIYLARDLNEHNRVQVSYSRRIARPSFSELAPFILFLDPTTFFSGNASLRPAFTDAFKADYRWKTLFLSLTYSQDKDAIARFQSRIDPETNLQTYFTSNLDRRETWALMVSYPLKISGWWESQANLIGTIQHLDTEFEGEQIETSQKSFTANTTQKFLLPADISLELSGNYMSPRLWGISTMKARGMVNFGIQKKLKKDWGTFNLSIRDIFWTNGMRWEAEQPVINLDLQGQFNFEPRVVRLTYTRKFGNKQVKGTRKRKTGSDEERKRVN